LPETDIRLSTSASGEAVNRRRRRHSEARPRRVSIRLSEAEFRTVSDAAVTARLSIGAWLADVAVQVAGAGAGGTRTVREQLEIRDALEMWVRSLAGGLAGS
jgi:hypothetical protein